MRKQSVMVQARTQMAWRIPGTLADRVEAIVSVQRVVEAVKVSTNPLVQRTLDAWREVSGG